MLQDVALGDRSLADYTHLVGRGLIEEIRQLAEPPLTSNVAITLARPTP